MRLRIYVSGGSGCVVSGARTDNWSTSDAFVPLISSKFFGPSSQSVSVAPRSRRMRLACPFSAHAAHNRADKETVLQDTTRISQAILLPH